MSANNNDDKSKIDKIREDLEKKLAALERTKLNKEEESIIENTSEVKAEEDEVKKSDPIDENSNQPEKSSFLDEISNIENETTIEKEIIESDEVEEQEDTIFEISDEIENIEEENSTEKTPAAVATVNAIDESNSSIVNEQNVVSDEAIEEEQSDIFEEEVEEEEKSSKINFIIYGLVGLLLVTVGYFAIGVMKGKSKLNSDKTNKKITELENRRYQDSIKLLEAEKRLAEFESQRYIDSVSLADRLKLTVKNEDIAKSDVAKKNKKVKAAKPTTTIYKNNKPVATSNSTVVFDDVVASTEKGSNENSNDVKSKTVIDEKDKKIAKEVKKEKKIETLNTVEKAPIYPGCEKQKTERAKKTCMISKINKFVNKNFNAYVAQDLGLDSGIQKIYVSFIIDRNGYVNVLRTRAKHEALKKEAVRVVNKLPRMKPAQKNGQKTQIVYNLPIVFSVEE